MFILVEWSVAEKCLLPCSACVDKFFFFFVCESVGQQYNVEAVLNVTTYVNVLGVVLLAEWLYVVVVDACCIRIFLFKNFAAFVACIYLYDEIFFRTWKYQAFRVGT